MISARSTAEKESSVTSTMTGRSRRETRSLCCASAGMTELDPVFTVIADIDSDGEIASADALEILRYSVQLSTNEKIGKPILA